MGSQNFIPSQHIDLTQGGHQELWGLWYIVERASKQTAENVAPSKIERLHIVWVASPIIMCLTSQTVMSTRISYLDSAPSTFDRRWRWVYPVIANPSSHSTNKRPGEFVLGRRTKYRQIQWMCRMLRDPRLFGHTSLPSGRQWSLVYLTVLIAIPAEYSSIPTASKEIKPIARSAILIHVCYAMNSTV